MSTKTTASQNYQRGAFLALATRLRASLTRVRNADKRRALAAKLAQVERNAKLAARGQYQAPAPTTTARTPAAIQANRTRTVAALERARNPDRKRELAAKVAAYDARLAALAE